MQDEGEAEKVSDVERCRKKGREGAKRENTTDNDGNQKVSKRKSTPKKSALYMYLLAHHMT